MSENETSVTRIHLWEWILALLFVMGAAWAALQLKGYLFPDVSLDFKGWYARLVTQAKEANPEKVKEIVSQINEENLKKWAKSAMQPKKSQQRVAPAPKIEIGRPKGYVGKEWNQVRLFKEQPGFEELEIEQQLLNEKLARQLAHTFDFGVFYSVYPKPLLYPYEFEEFALRPAFPLPGAVINLSKGISCIDFGWTDIPVRDVLFTLEIAKTRNFDFYRSFGTKTNSVRIEMKRRADYFWRVRATHRNRHTFSPVSSFLVLEPELTVEEKRIRDMTARMTNPVASLGDVQFCR